MNIASKAIVEKCHAEGIPESIIKNHMSTVSAGLEATIREWFSSDAHTTAIETSARVDLDKARAKPRRKGRHEGGDDNDSGGTAVEVRATPAPASAPERAPEPTRVRPVRPPTPRAVTIEDPPVAPAPPAPKETHLEPAARVSAPAPAPRAPATPPAKPAPMNVPERPRVVVPAGPKLQDRAPVKLSGPKVVRIEAAEVIAPPRPSRTGPSDGGGGRGVGFGPGTESDDRSKGGVRRGNRRRTPEGGGTGGAVAPVPAKRRGAAGEDWVGGAFTEQDLAEREARLQRSGGYLKMRRQQAKQRGSAPDRGGPGAGDGHVRIAAPFTVKDLSAATGVKAADIVKKLFLQGIVTTINSGIDPAKRKRPCSLALAAKR